MKKTLMVQKNISPFQREKLIGWKVS